MTRPDYSRVLELDVDGVTIVREALMDDIARHAQRIVKGAEDWIEGAPDGLHDVCQAGRRIGRLVAMLDQLDHGKRA